MSPYPGFIMTREEWFDLHGTNSHKCESCGKHYKMPGSIFEPRDRICCKQKL